MTESKMEERLRSMLAEHAEEAGPPSFGGDTAVLRGRAARRRRLIGVSGGVTAAVAALVLVGSLMQPQERALPPADQSPSPAPTATPSWDDAVFSADLAALPGGKPAERDLLLGDEIATADGGRVPLRLPQGLRAQRASRVPSGWIVGAYHDQVGFSIWLVRPGQAPRRLVSNVTGDYILDAAGNRLVVSHDSGVLMIGLPSGVELARTSYQAGIGPMIAGIVADRVVLQGVQGSGGPTDVAVWDTRDGVVTRSADRSFGVVDLTHDGQVVLSRRPSPERNEVDACTSVSSFHVLLTPGERRCGAAGAASWGARLSPNGELVAFTGHGDQEQRVRVGRVADLDEELFRSVTLGVPAGWSATPAQWEASDALLVEVQVPRDGADEPRAILLRCGTDGEACERVPLPQRDLPVDAVVPRYGS